MTMFVSVAVIAKSSFVRAISKVGVGGGVYVAEYVSVCVKVKLVLRPPKCVFVEQFRRLFPR